MLFFATPCRNCDALVYYLIAVPRRECYRHLKGPLRSTQSTAPSKGATCGDLRSTRLDAVPGSDPKTEIATTAQDAANEASEATGASRPAKDPKLLTRTPRRCSAG